MTIILIILLCCWMFLFKEVRRTFSYAVAVSHKVMSNFIISFVRKLVKIYLNSDVND